MMRAMSSAVAGLKAQQVGMDVIGNNIANVNTSGFKASRTSYSDVYYQTVTGSSAGDGSSTATTGASGKTGGSNSSQIGYGSTAATVDVITTRNGYDSTSLATDCYIDGDGYFLVQSSPANGNDAVAADASATPPVAAVAYAAGTVAATYDYTRVGNLRFDPNGQLTNAKGDLICGVNASVTESVDAAAAKTAMGTDKRKTAVDASTGQIYKPQPIKVANYSSYKNVKIGSDGVITGEKDGATATLGKIAIANIPNSAGLTQLGNSTYQASSNSGTATFYAAGKGTTGPLKTSALETSNVDLANEFANMITTQRGFQANSKIITVSDTMLEELCDMKR